MAYRVEHRNILSLAEIVATLSIKDRLVFLSCKHGVKLKLT